MTISLLHIHITLSHSGTRVVLASREKVVKFCER
jgi:hypothetical protein